MQDIYVILNKTFQSCRIYFHFILFQNIKLLFFPGNTKSAAQPMDAGKSQSAKYPKRQLQTVL